MKNKTIVNKVTAALEKGTCFAGFDYPDSKTGKIRRRNVTVGSDLKRYAKQSPTRKIWGRSQANGAIVEGNSNFYLQAIENNLETGPAIKRFAIDKISNFVIG